MACPQLSNLRLSGSRAAAGLVQLNSVPRSIFDGRSTQPSKPCETNTANARYRQCEARFFASSKSRTCSPFLHFSRDFQQVWRQGEVFGHIPEMCGCGVPADESFHPFQRYLNHHVNHQQLLVFARNPWTHGFLQLFP